MSKEDSGKGGFETLSMDKIASSTKKKEKGGSLSDLFKCVESLATSTESLRDYGSSGVDSEDKALIKKYLDGLSKIQDGLLEMAQNKVRAMSKMPAMEEGIDLTDLGKVAKV